MVKGISRQVIVLKSPDPELFEQAIFILRDKAVENGGITDEKLMKQARQLLHSGAGERKPAFFGRGPVWACAGAVTTGLIWLITALV